MQATAFGFVKGTLNFVAGRLSERIGRKRVLFLGWLAAVPTPFMILYASSWGWIVAATVLLGVNQGLAWSMTQTSKLACEETRGTRLISTLGRFIGDAARTG
jgi:MFS family permease